MRDNLMKKPFELYFDHTNLKPDATEAHIVHLCHQARDYGFYSVCVNPYRLALAKKTLAETTVKSITTIGFPLGASHERVKVYEAARAACEGADEIDMVINIGALKEGSLDFVRDEISLVVKAGESSSELTGDKVGVKVIIETCLLTDREIITACKLAKEGGADFVKTSTGFSSHGARADHVRLMRDTVGASMGVKAAGGIRDLETALAMIEAGADRLGSSNSVEIIKEYKGL